MHENENKRTHQVSESTIDWFCGNDAGTDDGDNVADARALVKNPKRLEFLMCLFVDADQSRARLLSLVQDLHDFVEKQNGVEARASVGMMQLEQALEQQDRVAGLDSLLGLAFVDCECTSVASMLVVLNFLQQREGWTILRVRNALLPPSWDGTSRGCAYPDLTLHARDEVNGHIIKFTLALSPLLQIWRRDGSRKHVGSDALLVSDFLRVQGTVDASDIDHIRSGLVQSLTLNEVEGLEPGEVPWERFGVMSPTAALTSLVVTRVAAFKGLSISTIFPADMLLQHPLSVLALAACDLKGNVPDVIANNCPTLEELSLERNPGLEGSLPDSLGRLSRLRVLRLFGCSLSGSLPKSLCELTRLKGIYLQVSL